MARSIICTNENGLSYEFKDNAFDPLLLLAHVEGIYEHENIVSIEQNAMIDGGTYQGSVAKIRNIVLTLIGRPAEKWTQNIRDILYVLFAEGKSGTLTYVENEKARTINYFVERVHQENTNSRLYTISLLCPDPFFYDTNVAQVDMANWVENFEFEHEFLAVGEELGYRSAVQLQNIHNDSASDNIGLEIEIKAIGGVTNPYISHVERNEILTINTTLLTGDVVKITTAIGNKHVYRTRAGITTEINQYLTEDSEFIQLHIGDNSIAYGATAGANNMNISIRYQFKYEGA